MFLTPLIVQKTGKNEWTLFAPLIWQTDTDTIRVPKGFVTDFASVPQPLWWFCPPAAGNHARAAVLHDHLCVCGKDQRRADRIFLEAMKADGVGWWKRNVMFQAVRAYQWGRGRY